MNCDRSSEPGQHSLVLQLCRQWGHTENFYYYGKNFINFTLLTIFTCKFSGIEHIHIVVQPTPPPISGTYSSSQTQTLSLLSTNSPFSSPQPLATSILLSDSELTILGDSYKWNHTVFVFCDWLTLLSIMSSRLIHVVTSIRISFLPE